MRRFLFLVMILLVACAEQVPSPRQEEAIDDWKRFDEGAFSFLGPPDLVSQPVQGIDSYVGDYQGAKVNVSFDFGWHSNNLDDIQSYRDICESPRDGFNEDFWASCCDFPPRCLELDRGLVDYEVMLRDINGTYARIATYGYAKSRVRVMAAHIAPKDRDPSSLTMYVEYYSEEGKDIARRILYSIEFAPYVPPCTGSCAGEMVKLCLPGTDEEAYHAPPCAYCPNESVDTITPMEKEGWVRC